MLSRLIGNIFGPPLIARVDLAVGKLQSYIRSLLNGEGILTAANIKELPPCAYVILKFFMRCTPVVR